MRSSVTQSGAPRVSTRARLPKDNFQGML